MVAILALCCYYYCYFEGYFTCFGKRQWSAESHCRICRLVQSHHHCRSDSAATEPLAALASTAPPPPHNAAAAKQEATNKLNNQLRETMLHRVTMQLRALAVKRRDCDVFVSAVLSGLNPRPIDFTEQALPQPSLYHVGFEHFVLDVPQLLVPFVSQSRNSQLQILDAIFSAFVCDPDKDWDDDIVEAKPNAFFCLMCCTLVSDDAIHEHPLHPLHLIRNLFRPTLCMPSFHSRFSGPALTLISKYLLRLKSVTKRRRSSSVVLVTHPHSTTGDELSEGIELKVNAGSEEVEELCHATNCEGCPYVHEQLCIVCLGCPSVHEELCSRGVFDSVRTGFNVVASLVIFCQRFCLTWTTDMEHFFHVRFIATTCCRQRPWCTVSVQPYKRCSSDATS